MIMNKLTKIDYKGKKILKLDFKGLSQSDQLEIKQALDETQKQIAKEKPNSVLIITIVNDLSFNKTMTQEFTDFANANKSFIKASTLVGLKGIQSIVVSAVKTFTGRDFHVSKTEQEALDWLEKQ